jgi:hypothetical protein
VEECKHLVKPNLGKHRRVEAADKSWADIMVALEEAETRVQTVEECLLVEACQQDYIMVPVQGLVEDSADF